MEQLQLFHVWTAGAVLVGFQIAAFTWRINREIAMEAEDERTWLTLADCLVGLSFLWVVVLVFAAPIKTAVSADLAAKFLGVGLFLFAAHPFVLIGHYNLYCSWGKYEAQSECEDEGRPPVTKQEITAFLVSVVLVVVGSWWILV